MARRANKGRVDGGPLLLIVIVAMFVIPAVLTFAVYAVIVGIIGLIIFEIKTGRRPSVTRASEFYSAEDCSLLDSLMQEQDQLRDRKARIYWDADQLRLLRRSQDPRRFDERSSLAKRLNAKLVKLDNEFAKIISNVEMLRSKIWERHDAWLKQFEHWRFWSSGRLAFRVALLAYVVLVAALFAFNPQWVQNFSDTVSRYVSFPAMALHGYYGAVVTASGISAALGAFTWLFAFRHMDKHLPDEQDFYTKWFKGDSREWLDNFVDSYWEYDRENEEEHEFADRDLDWDEQSGDQLTWYEALGVTSNASLDEIKAAYKEQIKQYHPDRVAALGPKLKALAELETKALNAAYEEALKRA
jgi:hypothetical protein